MSKAIQWKIGIIILVVGFSVLMFYPPKDKINLGLDLKGGIHLRMQVETDKAIEAIADNGIAQLKGYFAEREIKYQKMSKPKFNEIHVLGTSPDNERVIKEYLDEEFTDWNYVYAGTQCNLTLKPNIEMRLRDQSVNQAKETINNRIDKYDFLAGYSYDK